VMCDPWEVRTIYDWHTQQRRRVRIAEWDSIMAEFPKLPTYPRRTPPPPVLPLLTVAAYEFLRTHGPGTVRMIAVGVQQQLEDQRAVRTIQQLLYPHIQGRPELFEEVGSMLIRGHIVPIWGAKEHGVNLRADSIHATEVANMRME
jgi:hypothetical protein